MNIKTPTTETTSKHSERSIQDDFHSIVPGSFSLSIPNYTPPKWYECDQFCVTRALYSVEYEIKTTPSDFHRDKRKRRQFGSYDANRVWSLDDRTKHDRLASGDVIGPNRFYFVMPSGMIPVEKIPAWAGLIYVLDDHSRRGDVARRAPLLHRQKVALATAVHAGDMLTNRYWNERHKNNEFQREIEKLRIMSSSTRGLSATTDSGMSDSKAVPHEHH